MPENETTVAWLVQEYVLAGAAADALAETLSGLDFHSFTIASRSDEMVDLVLYGRDGQLPAAIQPLLASLAPRRAHMVNEAELIAHADSRQPVALCPGLTLRPEDATDHPPTTDTIITLGQGPAFGDGRHPTTRAAARLLVNHSWTGTTVYDVGAGSGVLGLIAHASGARAVHFGDNDADAVRTCRRSCVLNNYPQAPVYHSDLLTAFPTQQVDVVIANIYAELILELLASQELAQIVSQGHLFLSGISHHKVAQVRQVLATQGWHIAEQESEAWWHAIHATRGL